MTREMKLDISKGWVWYGTKCICEKQFYSAGSNTRNI